jgi:hypothetical protein
MVPMTVLRFDRVGSATSGVRKHEQVKDKYKDEALAS